MKLSMIDQDLLTRQLGELARAVEELLQAGLTAAGTATRETLDVTFREASRLKLLRLASTLRGANDEIGRFLSQPAEFSAKRLVFFLNRAWMLARGLAHAISTNNDAEWDRLLWMPETAPVERLDVVTLGVGKKVSKGTFCAFEFRLRRVQLEGNDDIPTRLSWSCIFPLRQGTEIPPEGFLQMPQKQKFKAAVFLEPRVISLTNVLVAADTWGAGKITLTAESTVTVGEAFDAWDQFQAWSPDRLLERVQTHEASPFDLEVELQDEAVLADWQVHACEPEPRDDQYIYPLGCGHLVLDAVVSIGVDGQALQKRMNGLVKAKDRSPLFGLVHFDRCRTIFQPLSLLGSQGPEFVMISNDKVDKAALLKTLKF